MGSRLLTGEMGVEAFVAIVGALASAFVTCDSNDASEAARKRLLYDMIHAVLKEVSRDGDEDDKRVSVSALRLLVRQAESPPPVE